MFCCVIYAAGLASRVGDCTFTVCSCWSLVRAGRDTRVLFVVNIIAVVWSSLSRARESPTGISLRVAAWRETNPLLSTHSNAHSTVRPHLGWCWRRRWRVPQNVGGTIFGKNRCHYYRPPAVSSILLVASTSPRGLIAAFSPK